MRHTEGLRSRRTVLTAVGSGLAVGVAGCLGNGEGDSELPAAVSLNEPQACDQCGMVIDEHPGPTGQLFFDDHPPDREGPAWFCSASCTYSYRFDREDEDIEPVVAYLTDYSHVDYSVDDGAEPTISAHLAADNFREESALSVVVGSGVEGAMGPELIPFADADDAEAFADEYGGEVRTATDVDRELVDSIRS